MLIEQMFKVFTQNTLAEPNNKSKKNHDLCIDVYAKAQLVDLCGVYNSFGLIDQEYKCVVEQVGKQAKATSILDSSYTVQLPFDVSFFKLYDTVCREGFDKAVYVFMREFEPMVYTGVVITEMKTGAVFKVPFTIRETFAELKLIVDIPLLGDTPKEHINSLTQFVMNKISRLLKLLNTMSHKTHDLYSVKATRAEYYRKKLTKETIKVERPVYIYLNKNRVVRDTPLVLYKGRKIEREISWLVRGHWRKLDAPNKRGKNAQGEYVIEGFTWVKPHVCGNKDIPVKNRVHIVLED